MKISELIEELEIMKTLHGDVEVVACSDEGRWAELYRTGISAILSMDTDDPDDETIILIQGDD